MCDYMGKGREGSKASITINGDLWTKGADVTMELSDLLFQQIVRCTLNSVTLKMTKNYTELYVH